MLLPVPEPMKGALYDGDLPRGPESGECVGMAWNKIKTGFGHVNRSGATLSNLTALFVVVSGVLGFVAKFSKPFVAKGWGWADAVLVGLAGTVGLAVVAVSLFFPVLGSKHTRCGDVSRRNRG